MSVDAAVDRINNNLNQNWLDWDVTESELKDNTQALKSLTPSERNQAIEKLSDEQLQHWADETQGKISPLKADDRRELLNMFAKDLSPAQLARVTSAFGERDMAQAVASHGTPQQKQAFIENLQGQVDASSQTKAGLGSVTSTRGNDSAHAVAQVLGSLQNEPKAFAQAVQGLQDAGKLDAVMKTASGETMVTISSGYGHSSTSVSFDDQNLQAILAGAANLPDTDLGTRTAIFEAAKPQLAAMQGAASIHVDPTKSNDGAAQRTADAMGKVLTQDQAIAAGLVAETPAMPADVSMSENIGEARAHIPDIRWFYNQVRNKGPWDYKQQGAQYQDFGNFNFGLAAAAMEIPEEVALRGAGWAQQRAGTSEDSNGWAPFNPFDRDGPYGDDPADQAQIKKGYEYYNSGLWRVWKD